MRFAVQIAKDSQGEVHLLHTVELPVLFDPNAILEFEEAYMAETRVKAEKKMKKIAEKYADGFQRVKFHVQFGKLQTNIHRLIESAKIDLIVAGTHGAKGLRELTIGSNAEKLVRNAEVPVIVVRKAPKEIKNIVFPTLPDMDQEDLTMRVKSMQDFFKAKLHILYVNTPANFVTTAAIDTMFTKFSKRFMLKNYDFHVYNDLTTDAGIVNFAKSINADMVVMRTHGRKGLAHLGSGSIAEDVVNHIECPVATFRIK